MHSPSLDGEVTTGSVPSFDVVERIAVDYGIELI